MERAIGGRRVPGLRHLAAVGIAEHDVDLPLVNGAVLGRCDVARAGDSLIEDDLSRSVDAAVGDEHDRGLRLGLHVPPEVRRIGSGLVPLAVDGRRGQHDIFPPLREPHFVAAFLIGRGGAGLAQPLRMVALLFTDEQLHGRAGHRLARSDIDDMAGDFPRLLVSRCVLRKCLPLLFRHDRQPRHPDQRHLHDIVGPAEVGLLAGDHPVGAGLEQLGIEGRAHGNVFVPLPVVVGGRQIECLRPHRRQGEDRLPIGIVDPAGVWLAGLETAHPVGICDPQMHLREIAVADANDRPRLRPRAFRLDRQLLRLDLRDEVFAHRAAGALGVRLGTLDRDGPRLDEVAIAGAAAVSLLEQAGEMEAGQRRCLVIPCPLDELLECVLLAVGKIGGVTLRHHRVACPEDAVEIGGQEGRAVGVGTMKRQQTAIELRGFEQR